MTRKPGKPAEKTYTLAESQLDAVGVALEQIEALANLIMPQFYNVEDAGALTALTIIAEKSRFCAVALRAGYAEPRLGIAIKAK